MQSLNNSYLVKDKAIRCKSDPLTLTIKNNSERFAPSHCRLAPHDTRSAHLSVLGVMPTLGQVRERCADRALLAPTVLATQDQSQNNSFLVNSNVKSNFIKILETKLNNKTFYSSTLPTLSALRGLEFGGLRPLTLSEKRKATEPHSAALAQPLTNITQETGDINLASLDRCGTKTTRVTAIPLLKKAKTRLSAHVARDTVLNNNEIMRDAPPLFFPYRKSFLCYWLFPFVGFVSNLTPLEGPILGKGTDSMAQATLVQVQPIIRDTSLTKSFLNKTVIYYIPNCRDISVRESFTQKQAIMLNSENILLGAHKKIPYQIKQEVGQLDKSKAYLEAQAFDLSVKEVKTYCQYYLNSLKTYLNNVDTSLAPTILAPLGAQRASVNRGDMVTTLSFHPQNLTSKMKWSFNWYPINSLMSTNGILEYNEIFVRQKRQEFDGSLGISCLHAPCFVDLGARPLTLRFISFASASSTYGASDAEGESNAYLSLSSAEGATLAPSALASARSATQAHECAKRNASVFGSLAPKAHEIAREIERSQGRGSLVPQAHDLPQEIRLISRNNLTSSLFPSKTAHLLFKRSNKPLKFSLFSETFYESVPSRFWCAPHKHKRGLFPSNSPVFSFYKASSLLDKFYQKMQFGHMCTCSAGPQLVPTNVHRLRESQLSINNFEKFFSYNNFIEKKLFISSSGTLVPKPFLTFVINSLFSSAPLALSSRAPKTQARDESARVASFAFAKGESTKALAQALELELGVGGKGVLPPTPAVRAYSNAAPVHLTMQGARLTDSDIKKKEKFSKNKLYFLLLKAFNSTLNDFASLSLASAFGAREIRGSNSPLSTAGSIALELAQVREMPDTSYLFSLAPSLAPSTLERRDIRCEVQINNSVNFIDKQFSLIFSPYSDETCFFPKKQKGVCHLSQAPLFKLTHPLLTSFHSNLNKENQKMLSGDVTSVLSLRTPSLALAPTALELLSPSASLAPTVLEALAPKVLAKLASAEGARDSVLLRRRRTRSLESREIRCEANTPALDNGEAPYIGGLSLAPYSRPERLGRSSNSYSNGSHLEEYNNAREPVRRRRNTSNLSRTEDAKEVFSSLAPRVVFAQHATDHSALHNASALRLSQEKTITKKARVTPLGVTKELEKAQVFNQNYFLNYSTYLKNYASKVKDFLIQSHISKRQNLLKERRPSVALASARSATQALAPSVLGYSQFKTKRFYKRSTHVSKIEKLLRAYFSIKSSLAPKALASHHAKPVQRKTESRTIFTYLVPSVFSLSPPFYSGINSFLQSSSLSSLDNKLESRPEKPSREFERKIYKRYSGLERSPLLIRASSFLTKDNKTKASASIAPTALVLIWKKTQKISPNFLIKNQSFIWDTPTDSRGVKLDTTSTVGASSATVLAPTVLATPKAKATLAREPKALGLLQAINFTNDTFMLGINKNISKSTTSSSQEIQIRKYNKKKRRIKKLKKETRHRKKRKRFFPRPIWIRYNIYSKFLKNRYFKNRELPTNISSDLLSKEDLTPLTTYFEKSKLSVQEKRDFNLSFYARDTKNFFRVSNTVINDFKRLLWKSYWLRSNFYPYLKKLKESLNEIKKSTQLWDFYHSLQSFMYELGGFSSASTGANDWCEGAIALEGASASLLFASTFGSLAPKAHEIARVRQRRRATLAPKVLAKAQRNRSSIGAPTQQAHPYINSNKTTVSVTGLSSKWQKALYFSEYNSITYQRLQQFLSQIRENLTYLSDSKSFLGSVREQSPLTMPEAVFGLGGSAPFDQKIAQVQAAPEALVRRSLLAPVGASTGALTRNYKVRTQATKSLKMSRELVTLQGFSERSLGTSGISSRHPAMFEKVKSKSTDFWMNLGKTIGRFSLMTPFYSFTSLGTSKGNLWSKSYQIDTAFSDISGVPSYFMDKAFLNFASDSFFQTSMPPYSSHDVRSATSTYGASSAQALQFAEGDSKREIRSLSLEPFIRMCWAFSKTFSSSMIEYNKRSDVWGYEKTRTQTKNNKTKKFLKNVSKKWHTFLNEQYELERSQFDCINDDKTHLMRFLAPSVLARSATPSANSSAEGASKALGPPREVLARFSRTGGAPKGSSAFGSHASEPKAQAISCTCVSAVSEAHTRNASAEGARVAPSALESARVARSASAFGARENALDKKRYELISIFNKTRKKEEKLKFFIGGKASYKNLISKKSNIDVHSLHKLKKQIQNSFYNDRNAFIAYLAPSCERSSQLLRQRRTRSLERTEGTREKANKEAIINKQESLKYSNLTKKSSYWWSICEGKGSTLDFAFKHQLHKKLKNRETFVFDERLVTPKGSSYALYVPRDTYNSACASSVIVPCALRSSVSAKRNARAQSQTSHVFTSTFDSLASARSATLAREPKAQAISCERDESTRGALLAPTVLAREQRRKHHRCEGFLSIDAQALVQEQIPERSGEHTIDKTIISVFLFHFCSFISLISLSQIRTLLKFYYLGFTKLFDFSSFLIRLAFFGVQALQSRLSSLTYSLYLFNKGRQYMADKGSHQMTLLPYNKSRGLLRDRLRGGVSCAEGARGPLAPSGCLLAPTVLARDTHLSSAFGARLASSAFGARDESARVARSASVSAKRNARENALDRQNFYYYGKMHKKSFMHKIADNKMRVLLSPSLPLLAPTVLEAHRQRLSEDNLARSPLAKTASVLAQQPLSSALGTREKREAFSRYTSHFFAREQRATRRAFVCLKTPTGTSKGANRWYEGASVSLVRERKALLRVAQNAKLSALASTYGASSAPLALSSAEGATLASARSASLTLAREPRDECAKRNAREKRDKALATQARYSKLQTLTLFLTLKNVHFLFYCFYYVSFGITKNVISILKETTGFLFGLLPRSLYTFFEKPGELIVDWIAYTFLVEWAADLTNLIPENVDVLFSTSSFKILRFLNSVTFLSNLAILFSFSNSYQIQSKYILSGSVSDYVNSLSLGFSNNINPALKNQSAVDFNFLNFHFLNIGSIFLQRRLYHLYEIFILQFFQPDMDIIIRHKKGIIFWDIWGDFLMQVAENSNINISELTSLKEEQFKLLESGAEALFDHGSILSPIPNIAMMWETSFGKKAREIKQPFQESSNDRGPSSSAGLVRRSSEVVQRGAMYTTCRQRRSPSQIAREHKRDKRLSFSTTPLYKITSIAHHSHAMFPPGQGKTLAISCACVSAKRNASARDEGARERNETLKPKKPLNFAHQNLNLSLLRETQAIAKTSSIFAFGEVGQFLSYQGKDTELFIDLYPPKSFTMLNFLKNNESIQPTVGSLVCQIHAGLLLKQVSKNVLVVSARDAGARLSLASAFGARDSHLSNKSTEHGLSHAKTLLIQAIAGETELKIITDNAYRYSLVYRGVAVGIKLLKEVFDSLALHTPCLFLMEDIHAIGSRRPLLISDDDTLKATEGSITGSQREEIHEKNQVLYQLSKHMITHYKKPYKGDFSLLIPTNHFCFDILRSNVFSSLAISREPHLSVHDMRAYKGLQSNVFATGSYNSSSSVPCTFGLSQTTRATREGFSHVGGPCPSAQAQEQGTMYVPRRHSFATVNGFQNQTVLPIISAQRMNNQASSISPRDERDSEKHGKKEVGGNRVASYVYSRLLMKSSELLAPPATSPFSVLTLKEEKKFQTLKDVIEMPWASLPGEQLAQVLKSSYSIRVKVALLADAAMSSLSVKLDMITDLLVIIDSVKGNRGFVVFATTHIPFVLDPALRRPGRLDETIILDTTRLPSASSASHRWYEGAQKRSESITSLSKESLACVSAKRNASSSLERASHAISSLSSLASVSAKRNARVAPKALESTREPKAQALALERSPLAKTAQIETTRGEDCSQNVSIAREISASAFGARDREMQNFRWEILNSYFKVFKGCLLPSPSFGSSLHTFSFVMMTSLATSCASVSAKRNASEIDRTQSASVARVSFAHSAYASDVALFSSASKSTILQNMSSLSLAPKGTFNSANMALLQGTDKLISNQEKTLFNLKRLAVCKSHSRKLLSLAYFRASNLFYNNFARSSTFGASALFNSFGNEPKLLNSALQAQQATSSISLGSSTLFNTLRQPLVYNASTKHESLLAQTAPLSSASHRWGKEALAAKPLRSHVSNTNGATHLPMKWLAPSHILAGTFTAQPSASFLSFYSVSVMSSPERIYAPGVSRVSSTTGANAVACVPKVQAPTGSASYASLAPSCERSSQLLLAPSAHENRRRTRSHENHISWYASGAPKGSSTSTGVRTTSTVGASDRPILNNVIKNYINYLISGKFGEMFFIHDETIKSNILLYYNSKAYRRELHISSRESYCSIPLFHLLASLRLAPHTVGGSPMVTQGDEVVRENNIPFSPLLNEKPYDSLYSKNSVKNNNIEPVSSQMDLPSSSKNLLSCKNQLMINKVPKLSIVSNTRLALCTQLTSLILSFIQKRYIYYQNLIVPEFLYFVNKSSFFEPLSPPTSNILLPARRYENYRRSFAYYYLSLPFMKRTLQINNNIIDKINLHQQQRLIKRLYRYPVKETFKSEFSPYISKKDNQSPFSAPDSLHTFSPHFASTFGSLALSAHECAKRNAREQRVTQHDAPKGARTHVLGATEENLTNFSNATLMIGSLSSSLNFNNNTNKVFRHRILLRHRNHLTNQWWNGQLPEHNAETTFLSDIDWRYSFMESVGDLLLDFPDADQHYNPQNRRWLLTKGSFNYWFDFEKRIYSDFYSHLIFDCFLNIFHIYEKHRDILDYYAYYVLNKGQASMENLYKKFSIPINPQNQQVAAVLEHEAHAHFSLAREPKALAMPTLCNAQHEGGWGMPLTPSVQGEEIENIYLSLRFNSFL